ncbi:MAG TPA: hypothetical protein VF021_00285, partial [Longimicrobiales bacterium]
HHHTEDIMRTPQLITLGVVALSLTALRSLGAQTAAQALAAPPEFSSRSAEYEQRAVDLYSDITRAAEAARLHRWSAQLRADNDPEAVESLAMAARLFGYAHQTKQARKTMEEAAERALGMGDVARAARAYLDAAFYAVELKQNTDIARLGRKALLLAGSPVLTDEQRKSITDRIRVDARLASAVQ